MLDTASLLHSTNFPPIYRRGVEILQFNLGYLCNLSCTHCHVNAGPKRTELATRETIESVLSLLRQGDIKLLDLTGGAPEMNPEFEYLVREARKLSVQVIDRCNLTILNEPGFEHMAEFLAAHSVNITASLPCYSEKNVSEQRGKGVFESSIEALQKLNRLGYGKSDALPLNLVYNPNGAFLPPGQQALEEAYKKQLKEQFDIDFNALFTITNMPISRFGSMLLSKKLYEDYMVLLRENFSAQNLHSVMCLDTLSIDYRGYLYDCDFNQMLDWPLQIQLDDEKGDKKSVIASDKTRKHIDDILQTDLTANPIVIGDHCYGCTAGQGSSCGGALG